MKAKIKRARKLMRTRNTQRVNRLRNQQMLLSPLMVLVLVKLGLDETTTPAKMVLRLQLHAEKLTGNLNFPVTDPSIAVLEALATELAGTIIAIEGGDLSKIPHRDTLMVQAKNAIHKLSYDIQFQSNGNTEKIQSAGFAVNKGKVGAKPVGDAFNLRTKPVGPGKIKLRWKRILGSRMNYIETTTDPLTGNWKTLAKTTRSSFLVEGLVPGSLHFYRVYGSNSLGDGNPSDNAEQRSL